MEHNKLVRDNIPQIILNSGEKPIYYTLSEEEYKKELDKKLQEEVTEYLNDDNVEEIADIVEVIQAILKQKQVSLEEFEKIRATKRAKRGGFDKRIFLERTIEKDRGEER